MNRTAMNQRGGALTALAALLTLTAAVTPALPAAAANHSSGPRTAGAETATLAITGGTLDITVAAAPVDLGAHPSTGNATITGKLGKVTVTDRRGAPPGSSWVASVTSTDFTTGAGAAIPAATVSYTTGPITTTGTAHDTADNPQNLRRPTAAVTATNITGNNTATWTPTLHVHLPPTLTAGVYTATITHSVT